MDGNDIRKFIGGIDFQDLKAQRVQLYNTITINLATARADEEHVFTGNYVYALEATDVDANLNIRFNEKFRGQINLVKGRGVRVPFYRFYITNTAQAGKTITLAIGIESDSFEVFDVGKALGITGTVDVNIVEGTPLIPSTATEINVSGERDASPGEVVLREVTGTTFYLTSYSLWTAITTVGDSASLLVSNAADAVQYRLEHISPKSTADSISANLSLIPPVEVPTGWKVKLVTDGSSITARGYIHGYEV